MNELAPHGASTNQQALIAGAVVDWPGGTLTVLQVGERSHSGGYGPVDFIASSVGFKVGTLVRTPWGMAEIVAMPYSVQPPAMEAIAGGVAESRG